MPLRTALAALILLAACATTRPRPAPAVATDCFSPAVVADALNLQAQNRRTLDRIARLGTCRRDPRAQVRALMEARRLVERAETASPAERERLERRAGELLHELRGF